MLKEGLELGEKTATWAEEKAAYLVTVTNLDQPLKKIDHAALNGVVQLENTQNQVSLIDKTLRSLKSIVISFQTLFLVEYRICSNQVRTRFQSANKAVQTRIETTTKTVSQGTEWVRSFVFTPAHNAMDFVENKMESVMLKPTSGMLLKYLFYVSLPH